MSDLCPWDVLVFLWSLWTDAALASGALGSTCRILGDGGVYRVTQIGSALAAGSSIRADQRTGISWVRDACGACVMGPKDGNPLFRHLLN